MIDRNGEINKNYLREGKLYNFADPEDTELAYQLQNGQIDNQEIIKQLVYRFSANLYLWIEVNLEYYRSAPPNPNEVAGVLREILSKAILQVDQFHGQTSVMNWLFELSLLIIKSAKRNLEQVTNIHENFGEGGIDNDGNRSRYDFWKRLDSLNEKSFRMMVLRYLFGVEISDIAHILNVSGNEIFKQLVTSRKLVFRWEDESHKHKQLLAYLDGTLNEKQNEVVNLEQHIISCSQCQLAITQIKDIEKIFRDSITSRWKLSDLDDELLNSLVQYIIHHLVQSKDEIGIQVKVKQSAWFSGFALLFVLLAVMFIKMTPKEREFPTPSPTAQQQLPPIIDMQPAYTPPDEGNVASIAPKYVEPDFSNDGNWAVFSSISADPVSGLLLLPTIELFDRSSNLIKVIQKSDGILNAYWSGWDLAPSISADGRWVAFPGAMDDPEGRKNACTSSYKNSCLDIFLYDRETGKTRQITHAWDGSVANGMSLSPAISADGKWIAFWSLATNLIEGDEITCNPGNSVTACMYVYIYNQETATIARVPIGTIIGGSSVTLGPISLSNDGHYIGFTVSIFGQTTYPATYDGVTYIILGNLVSKTQHYRSFDYFDMTTEFIVYDRETGRAEIENRAENGDFGNGASSSGVLSGDGRYVAFVSGSTNLVEGDVNESTDVYVRDRMTGSIDMVSVNSAGVQGNGDSGFTQWRRGYNSLDISADGRYVVFESTATNLGQRLKSDCYFYQTKNCILLYLHDRKTKQTELINSLPNGDFLRYPNISSDGRWVSYMQSKYKCSVSQEFCSNVMLYDQRNNWVRNLTNYGSDIPRLPWPTAGSVELPWESWESKAMAFSANGSLIAIGGLDSKIRVWKTDLVTNSFINEQPLQVLTSGEVDIFTEIKFSPNGRWLTAGTATGIVYIWRIIDGGLIYTLDEGKGFIKDLMFTKDCTELAILTSEKTSIWQIDEGKLINLSRYNHGPITALSPSGEMLAIDHGDGEIWLQKLPSGETIARLANGLSPIKDMVFSDDSSILAVRLETGMINIWGIQRSVQDSYSITPGVRFKSINVNGKLIFSPNNLFLSTSGTYGDVVMWSVSDGKMYLVPSSFENRRVDSLAFSRNGGNFGVVVENELILWDVDQETAYQYFNQSQEELSIYTELQPEPNFDEFGKLDPVTLTNVNKLYNLADAAELVDFPLIIPTRMPEFVTYSKAFIYDNGSICLQYKFSEEHLDQSNLYLCETFIENSSPPSMTISAKADILPVDVETISGIKKAEYVRGDWFRTESDTLSNQYIPAGDKLNSSNWNEMSASQRMQWVQYGILIMLYYQVGNPSVYVDPVHHDIQGFPIYLNQTDLIQIASGLRKYEEVSYFIFPGNGG